MGATQAKPAMDDNETDKEARHEVTKKGEEFEWSYAEEPHATRRKMILAAHPEIKDLFGYHPHSKYYAAGTVVFQLGMACVCAHPDMGWCLFLLLAWGVGGTCVHSLTLAIHELSHNLFFKKPSSNKWFAFFCNWPMVIPYVSFFKRYHLEHHKFQGVDGMDTDIPTVMEGKFFTTPFRKCLFMLLQPAFYALRPMIVKPKPWTQWEVTNALIQLTAMFFLFKLTGPYSILYLFLSLILGLGAHPGAGHFISEHYTTLAASNGTYESSWSPIKAGGKTLYVDETFSYRGAMNMISYNVGYHVAHHDFPFISGLRLPELEKMAPEFYDHLPSTTSWPGAIYDYIFSPCTPYNRVKRPIGKSVESKKVQ